MCVFCFHYWFGDYIRYNKCQLCFTVEFGEHVCMVRPFWIWKDLSALLQRSFKMFNSR